MENVIDIIVRQDGVYLYINRPPGNPAISRMDVLSLIESYGVADVDFVRLNDALKQENEELELKISNNTNIIQHNETAAVEISMDRMEAYISFSEPVNKGKLMTPADVVKLLTEAGVTEYNPDRLEPLLKNKRYGRKYTIAAGRQPVKGIDGFLQYHFDNSSLRPKPKIMDDGTVNLRDLGLYRLCNRGDVLVTSVQPKDGRDGVDVCGKPIPFTKGRMPLPIPRGKNTVMSEDGLHLIADVSGQLVLQDGKINVSPCLEINGNVDNSTGDIDFNGIVTIRGNVITGFTVKALGNIEVQGVCEGATLTSGANIVLTNGAQGMDKAVLTAAGDITAKFIESCTVNAGGNISADSILKSTVRCDGNVNISGKNGLLVGGSLIAGNSLTAKSIGSTMGTQTDVEVGSNPDELKKHRELVAEYEKMKGDFEKCEKAVEMLSALKKKNQLSEEKKNTLLKMLNVKMIMRERMAKLQQQIESMVQAMTINTGTVSASRYIRAGVRVTIGNATMVIRDDLQNCKLRHNGSKIEIGPCV